MSDTPSVTPGATFDVAYTAERNRLTTAFRLILAIPHQIVQGAWQYLTQALAVIQWFIVLFTGKRNEGIFNLQSQWLGYASRVASYTGLMYDRWPPFGPDPGGVTPVSYRLDYTTEANRLTNALRIIWAIPAVIIMMAVTLAGVIVTIISWFAIVFTGTHPRGMFDFLVKVHRYAVRTNAYVLLMTDTYPKYE